MSRRAWIVAAALLIASGLALGRPAIAEEKPELTRSSTMHDVLASNVGKRISLRTDGGETIDGTVTFVGDQLVHVSRLAGREFYDAVVRVDKVQSVTFRAR